MKISEWLVLAKQHTETAKKYISIGNFRQAYVEMLQSQAAVEMASNKFTQNKPLTIHETN